MAAWPEVRGAPSYAPSEPAPRRPNGKVERPQPGGAKTGEGRVGPDRPSKEQNRLGSALEPTVRVTAFVRPFRTSARGGKSREMPRRATLMVGSGPLGKANPKQFAETSVKPERVPALPGRVASTRWF